MAVMKQGILGGLQNKIGSVVGSSWKGIAVLKSKPLSVANPKTAGQIAQRTKMTNIVAFAQIILADLIKPLWDRFASRMSGYNDFVQANIALFAAAMPSPVANFILSKGKMAETAITTAVADISDHRLALEWVDDSGQGLKLATDTVYALGFDANTGDVFFSAGVVTRADANVNITFPATVLIGHAVHAYLAFRRADGTVVSNTTYKVATVQA